MNRLFLTLATAFALTIIFTGGALSAQTVVHYDNLDDPGNQNGSALKIWPDTPAEEGIAQKFIASGTIVSAVTLGVARFGSPGGTLVLSIWGVDAASGNPGERIGTLGEVAFNSLPQISRNALPAFLELATVEGLVTGLTPGTEYWLVTEHNDETITSSDSPVYAIVRTPSDIEPIALFDGDSNRWIRRLFPFHHLHARIEGRLPKIATYPSPADEMADVPRDVVLAWSPGVQIATHDVYLGTSLEDVNDASRDDPRAVLLSQGQPDVLFTAEALEFGRTYYWRIDEVNGAPDFTVFPGQVWRFEVEPFAYPITNITATASGAFGISVPENTINGSGLVDDLHGVSADDMWVSAAIPAWIQYEFDRVYKLHEMWIWNANQLIEPLVGLGAKQVVIEHSLNGTEWTVLEGVTELAQGPGKKGYAANNVLDFDGAMAHYVRMTINSVHGVATQASLSEVRFLYKPVFAQDPLPSDGASESSLDTVLSWRPGREAESHQVFLSDAMDAVLDESALIGTSVDASFDLSGQDLKYRTTYFWKVNEVNDLESPSVHAGSLWQFESPDFIAVDDMERYKDQEGLEIWQHWVDGVGNPANGSIVGNENDAETVHVSEGDQSLPMLYDNGPGTVSAATRTFDPPLDWVRGNPEVLSIFFLGDPTAFRNKLLNDPAPLYVVITDSSGQTVQLDYPNPEATHITSWTEWIIPLSELGGMELSSVESITIGVGGDGKVAKGKMFFDNVRVGTPAP